MLGTRLSEELEHKLEEYIATNKMTKSQFVKQAITVFLREQELKEWHEAQTTQGLKEIRRGKGIPASVVFKLLDRWGRND